MRLIKLLFGLCFLSLFIITAPLLSLQVINDGPVHEAYLTRVADRILLDAVPAAPPEPFLEKIPPKIDPDALWIEGYWHWDEERQDFLWVSGIWRFAPPGRQWIKSSWQHYDEGWVRIPGFWSDVSLAELSYLQKVPPDPIDENVTATPGRDFFWVAGYWQYNPEISDYTWVGGYWEHIDPNWVLVPAHYMWQPEGYVFVSAYWDYPMGTQGTAYAAVFFPPVERVEIVYQPTVIVEPLVIIENYAIYYPDFFPFYHHHFHYHVDYWENIGFAPPWWAWNGWWGLPWQNQWAIWWWYTHPGYPAPLWLPVNLARNMYPPSHHLLRAAKRSRVPSIVTPKGVVTTHNLLKSLKDTEQTKGRFKPVLPANPKQLERIKEHADRKLPRPNKGVEPTGKLINRDELMHKQPLKPLSDPNAIKKIRDTQKRIPSAKIPSKPSEEILKKQQERAKVRALDKEKQSDKTDINRSLPTDKTTKEQPTTPRRLIDDVDKLKQRREVPAHIKEAIEQRKQLQQQKRLQPPIRKQFDDNTSPDAKRGDKQRFPQDNLQRESLKQRDILQKQKIPPKPSSNDMRQQNVPKENIKAPGEEIIRRLRERAAERQLQKQELPQKPQEIQGRQLPSEVQQPPSDTERQLRSKKLQQLQQLQQHRPQQIEQVQQVQQQQMQQLQQMHEQRKARQGQQQPQQMQQIQQVQQQMQQRQLPQQPRQMQQPQPQQLRQVQQQQHQNQQLQQRATHQDPRSQKPQKSAE